MENALQGKLINGVFRLSRHLESCSSQALSVLNPTRLSILTVKERLSTCLCYDKDIAQFLWVGRVAYGQVSLCILNLILPASSCSRYLIICSSSKWFVTSRCQKFPGNCPHWRGVCMLPKLNWAFSAQKPVWAARHVGFLLMRQRLSGSAGGKWNGRGINIVCHLGTITSQENNFLTLSNCQVIILESDGQ